MHKLRGNKKIVAYGVAALLALGLVVVGSTLMLSRCGSESPPPPQMAVSTAKPTAEPIVTPEPSTDTMDKSEWYGKQE